LKVAWGKEYCLGRQEESDNESHVLFPPIAWSMGTGAKTASRKALLESENRFDCKLEKLSIKIQEERQQSSSEQMMEN
jgi:hypothetical protein